MISIQNVGESSVKSPAADESGLHEATLQLLRYRQVCRNLKLFDMADEIKSMFPEYVFEDSRDGFVVVEARA